MTRCLKAGLFLLPFMAPALMTPAWAACPLPGQTPMLLVKLYFGQSMEGGREVSPRDWQQFLSNTVTPHLPDGFTVYDAEGQWADAKTHSVARERTKVVEVAAPDTPALRKDIAEIASRYRAAFHQRSVGVVTEASCGQF